MRSIKIAVLICLILLSAACSKGEKDGNSVADEVYSESGEMNEYTSVAEDVYAEENSESGADLQELQLLSDRVRIKIPVGFQIMSDEIAAVKYPNGNAPALIYTNEKTTINIAFSHSETPVAADEMEEVKNSLVETFEKAYPSATWYDTQTLEINERKAGFIEILTPAEDTEIYNLMFFTEMDSRLLIISFNCTLAEMEEWQPIAKEIMNSLVIE